ncbi:unnamed protein product [Linum trigynum]|uniref:Uncharacterized protein n=1 Tax=Linum trigynum TaxID=586398 RepID=A0AAV2EHC0_9ROSI
MPCTLFVRYLNHLVRLLTRVRPPQARDHLTVWPPLAFSVLSSCALTLLGPREGFTDPFAGLAPNVVAWRPSPLFVGPQLWYPTKMNDIFLKEKNKSNCKD